MADDKSARRSQRQGAIKSLNELGAEIDADPLVARPSKDAVEDLYRRLCEALPSERRDALRAAREQWCSNGGAGDMLEHLLFEEAHDAEDNVPALKSPCCCREGHKKGLKT